MAQKNPIAFRLIWSITMVVIYLGMFYLLVFTGMFKQYSTWMRYSFGCVFLLYGMFRAWKILLKDKR